MSKISLTANRPQGFWDSAGEHAEYPANIEQAASAVVDGVLYCFGGVSNGADATYAAKYDPATRAWVSILALPIARRYMAAAVWGKKIYLLCGYHGASTDFWVYDTETNSYDTTRMQVPWAVGYTAACAYNEFIYYFCGCGQGDQSRCYKYDIANDNWTRTLNDAPNYREGHSIHVWRNKAIILGGRNYSGVDYSVWEFDFEHETFDTSRKSSTWEISYQSSARKDNIIYCLTSPNAQQSYDILANKWSLLPDGFGVYNVFSCVQRVGDEIHVVGGRNYAGDTNYNYHRVFYPFSLSPIMGRASNFFDVRNFAASASPRIGQGAANVDGNIFNFGGAYGTSDYNWPTTTDANKWTKSLNAWSSILALPAARCYTWPVANDRKIYIPGGNASVTSFTTATDTLWAYDVDLNSYDTGLLAMPGKRGAAGSCIWNGYLFVIGGYDETVALKSTVLRYSIATGEWVTMPTAMPFALAFYGASVIATSRYIYVVAGLAAAGGTNYFLRYDPINDSWLDLTATLPYPGPAGWGISALVVQNSIYCFGGIKQAGGYHAECYKFVENEKKWYPLKAMPDTDACMGVCFDGELVHLTSGEKSSGYGTLTPFHVAFSA